MSTFTDALLALASQYETAVATHGGRSLARVATLVVSRGSFFGPLRAGQTCSVRNFEKLVAYFQQPGNWPGGMPDEAHHTLASVGREALAPC